MRVLIALLVCASLAAADEVRLKAGGKFSGVVEEKGDKVIVRMEHGTLTFDRSQVEQIDRAKPSVAQEYERQLQSTDLTRADQVETLLNWAEDHHLAVQGRELRERLGRLRWQGLDQTNPSQLEIFGDWARSYNLMEMAKTAFKKSLALRREKVGAADADGLYKLGLWAKTAGLSADAMVLFQEAITANPDHEFARRALGYQFYAGKWRTPTELKTAMGLIEFEGDWMTPQAKEAIITSRTLEKERKLLDEARRKLEEERTLSRIEYERRKAELDARLSEIERARPVVVTTTETVVVPVPVPVPPPTPVPTPRPTRLPQRP